jgi:PHS family inorganic phosphate transporter-like MFS transporter
MVTLVGAIIGQVGFGFAADRWGRAKFYGYELAILLVSTIGVSMCSYGVLPATKSEFRSSMSVHGWFYFWRTISGIGVGAEYPLTAVLTAEYVYVHSIPLSLCLFFVNLYFRWASYSSRARMLAAVFLMQPIGQLCAAAAGWIAVEIVNKKFDLQNRLTADPPLGAQDTRTIVDSIWRGVVGFGALPALIAICFRVILPDPGRWTIEVQEDLDRGVRDTNRWSEKWRSRKRSPAQRERRTDIELESAPRRSGRSRTREDEDDTSNGSNPESLKTYLKDSGNWPLLFGTCSCWFLLDLAFYGLGINSSQTLALIWASVKADETVGMTPPPAWNPDPTRPNDTIYEVLVQNSKKSIYTASVGSLFGSILLLVIINRVSRKQFLAYSFLVLAAFLFATGITLLKVFGTSGSTVTLVLYGLCQLLFNLGNSFHNRGFVGSKLTVVCRTEHAHIHHTCGNISNTVSLLPAWPLRSKWKIGLCSHPNHPPKDSGHR